MSAREHVLVVDGGERGSWPETIPVCTWSVSLDLVSKLLAGTVADIGDKALGDPGGL